MADLTGAAAPSRGLSGEAAASASGLSTGRTVWAVGLLAIVALLAAADRNIMSVLLVPIQKELGVSDGAMGMLTGTAFAVVYSTMALPLSRLVDRGNRRTILSLAVFVWSAATALAGLATSYVHLLLARIGVAGAESVHGPASLSLIADLVPRKRRGTAISVYILGSALGFSLGAYAAGAINERYGWHVALMAVGAPGLIAALLLLFTVPEPRRGGQDSGGEAGLLKESFLASLGRIARIRTIWLFGIGFVLLNMAFQSWLIWMPAFLMRVHHLPSAKMGAVFGGIVAGGALSGLVAGPISDVLARHGERWRLYYCCGVVALAVPLLAASSLVPSLGAAIGCALAYTLVSGGLSSVGATVYLSVSPAHTRGLMAAIMALCINMLGSGLGGPLLGFVNDALKPTWGDESLRYTLLLGPAFLLLAGVFLFAASRTVEADVERAIQPL